MSTKGKMQWVAGKSIEALAEDWDPGDRPVHCSNCGQTRVSGDPEAPEVACAAGWGQGKALAVLIRGTRPRWFRDAAQCPNFQAMDDGA